MAPETQTPAGRAADRRLVLVAGTGRSGTSTLAGILRRVGLHVPQPEVGSDPTNPRGFGEPRWVVDFHDELLRRANVQVSDARPVAWERTAEMAELPEAQRRLDPWLGEQLDHGAVVLIKDPRLSWFLPLWMASARRLGAEPAFVTMLRPPAEVVGSRRTYYNAKLQDGQGIAAWLNMMLGTERATRGASRVMVRYHDLLGGWQQVTTSIGKHLDLAQLTEIDQGAREEIDAFVDPGLRRISLTWDDLDLPDRLSSLALDAWTSLDQLASGASDASQHTTRLDNLRAGYESYYLESEVVSRSSVIAARHEAMRRPPPPITARTALLALALSVTHRLPAWVRRLVPARVRAAVHARMGRQHVA